MKVSGSLTAGGGAGRCFCCRLASWSEPEPDPAPVRDSLPPVAPAVGVSFLALAFFSGAAFLDVAFFLVAFRDFSGSGGCRASSTASSTALEKTGLSLAAARGRRGGGDRPGCVDRGRLLLGRALAGLGALLGSLLGRFGQFGRLGRSRAGIPLRSGVGGRGPALGAPYGQPGREDPAHAGHRLAADQPSILEEPGMLSVEFLEGVVGQDGGAGALGDPQHEGIAATDGARRRRDHLTVQHGLAHFVALGISHTVFEGCVDHDDDAGARVLGGVRAHGLVELLEAGERSSFGSQVGPVHHDVVRFSQWPVATGRPAPTGAGRRSRWRGSPTRAG